MEYPEDAEEPVYNYHWWFEVNGEEQVITTQGNYPDVDGKFLRVDTELVSLGYEPPILDFTIEKDGGDYTEQFLNTRMFVMVVAYDLNIALWGKEVGMVKCWC